MSCGGWVKRGLGNAILTTRGANVLSARKAAAQLWGGGLPATSRVPVTFEASIVIQAVPRRPSWGSCFHARGLASRRPLVGHESSGSGGKQQEGDGGGGQRVPNLWLAVAAAAGVSLGFASYLEEEPLLSKNGRLQGLLVRCESWSLRGSGTGPSKKDRNMTFSEEERDILDYYNLQVELGRGVHAVVRIGTNKQTGEKVAVKCVEKANMRRRQLAREIQILTTVNHPNVISLKDVFEDDKTVYLVLELIEGGELFDRIVNDGAFSEQDAAKLVRKITEGLLHLHEHKVCHRDLKPENLLLTTKGSDADVKIADFGLSKVLGEKTMMKRSCGTWAYWAPEILRRQPYDYSVDLWSVGVILYIMLSGVHPFDPDGQSTDAQIVERILRADYTFEPEHWGHVSKEAMDVIRHLIHMDPMQRYTCKQLLQHPWVAGTDVSDSPMPSDALDSLRDFNRQRRNFSYLRKVNRTTLFESEIAEMKQVFDKYSMDTEGCDENGKNCTLAVMVLGKTMRALGENVSDREAMSTALNGNLIDSQGRLSFTSFVGIMSKYVEGRETEEDLRASFDYLDVKKQGYVSASDIQRALALVGVALSESKVREMISANVNSANKDKITFVQFQDLFQQSKAAHKRNQ